MERIAELIDKLKMQLEQNAGPLEMQITLQQLQTEMGGLQFAGNRVLSSSRVAVILPQRMNIPFPEADKKHFRPAAKRVVQETKETLLVQQDSVSIVQKNGQLDMVFDPMLEIPTLAHQLRQTEVNEAVSPNEATINDKLKQGKAELMEVLRTSPVKDLRKAIGINDRFHFVNELFGGDEAGYERAVKTINGFNIYAEAEFWISRELKEKLSWDENSEIVKEFLMLVKRRFS